MSLTYYLETFWEETGDWRVSSLPLMHGGPWSLLAMAAVYLYGLTTLLPKWIKQSKSELFDVKPWYLIYYGFMFGAHGVGTVLTLAVLDLKKTWTCDALNTNTTDLRDIGLMYAAYVMFAVKICHLIEPVFAMISDRAEKSQTAEAVSLIANILLIRFAYKVAPGNAFLYIALAEMLFRTFLYGYQALAVASPEFHPSPRWKNVLSLLRLVHLVSLFAHGLHLIAIPNCAVPQFVSFYECMYALLSTSYLALNYVQQAVFIDRTSEMKKA